MLTEHFSAMQKLENRADQFSQLTTYFDDPGGVAREAERYQEIEAGDLTDFAAQCCSPSQRVVVQVVPRQSSGSQGEAS
jgi:predicted Zn-dependent peptidase